MIADVTTRGRHSLRSMPRLLIAAALLTLALAACGGSKKTSTSTTTASTTSTPAQHHKGSKVLLEQVRAVGSSGFASSIIASPGGIVDFHTILPGTVKTPQTVTLSFAQGPSKTLKVTASMSNQSSTATVKSTGSSLTLMHLHYACALPPIATFCPVRNVATSNGQTRIQFSTSRKAPITVLATLGPVSLPTLKVKAPGSAHAPAYSTKEGLKVLPGGKATGASKGAFTASASAKSGDIVEMLTRVLSKHRGALQPITVTIARGSGKTIKVSASAQGGATSTATLKSSSGSPITLALPRYTCYLPPVPTFCPPTKTSASSSAYSATFMAAPGTAVPILVAKVQ
jgi:hypothetical protein